MLLTNRIYGVQVVTLGLSNGARGVVLGVRYNESGSCEYVVVSFASYTGPPFWEHAPHAVPIPQYEDCGDTASRGATQSLTNIPLALCDSMTIHKAQGLTASQGVVLNYKSSVSIASRGPLSYVGTTRTVSWSKFGVASLPPYSEFLEARARPIHAYRAKYEADMDQLHAKTMAAFFGGPVSEYDLHVKDRRDKGLADWTEVEANQVRAMIEQKGVQAVPQASLDELRAEAGPAAMSVNRLISYFRSQKKGKRITRLLTAAEIKRRRRTQGPRGDSEQAKKAIMTNVARGAGAGGAPQQVEAGAQGRGLADGEATPSTKARAQRSSSEDGNRLEMDMAPGVRDLVRRDRLAPLEVPGDGNCLYHCFARHLGGQHTCDSLRQLVHDSADLLSSFADPSLISEIKASAAAGIRYHALGQHIAEDAWGGDEAAHILAIT